MCDVGLIISIQPIQDSLERDVIEKQLALALSPSSEWLNFVWWVLWRTSLWRCTCVEQTSHRSAVSFISGRLTHTINKYTVSPKNLWLYIFYNNFNNKCPITIIFGIVSSKSMSHRKMVSFPTSSIYCNYLTLGNHRTQKNDKFRRKQRIVLWINNVLQHVWLLEASAKTARHRSNTGSSPSPQGWQISVQSYPLVTRQRTP